MDDLQILVQAVVDESSASTLNSQLANLVKSLSGSHDVKLRVVLDNSSVQAAQTQLQAIAKQVSSASKAGGSAKLQIFDAAQLQADGQRYFLAVKDIVSRAQAEFGKLGKVDITNVFKDAKGNIQSFTASVTKADGIVEKFNFNLAKIKDGTQALKGFVQSNSILADKNAGTNLEQTLNYLNRIDTKIADITSKTLVNTSKPLLGDMEQFNQYQTKLQQVQSRIQEITSSTSTLSAEHKREINSMVADLQRYAKELQTSAYAATDLKANTFANKKAELQAALNTDIQKWTNAGLFGGDFKASVEEAKAALDSALNPADLDAYRHKLSMLQQQFRQMKLEQSRSGSLIDAERLNSNIQTAQLRIQNLKQTYSSFVNDPALLSKWQQLFDESKVVSSQKELTNLNAKIRLFEQQLISAGKHSRSLWGELQNNAKKMASWMLLGGVIASVMRGVTGLYDAVLDLDSAMVELKKVTNETDRAYSSFLSSAAEKSVEIGTSYSDFVNATADFARLGYNVADASNLAEVATIYSVVGDEINGVDDATSSIISTMKAFGIEASNAIIIVDKFNEVGNNFAISSGGIGDAMQRSAAALAEANNTIDESIALIVAANNVIQDPDMVGTMWKTVSMRIRGAKTELEEAGLETEFMAESTSKLRDSIKGLTNIDNLGGFDIMKDEKTFKSTYDIILGISKVWEKMSDIDQAALLELLAGKRQGNALAAAISNMDDAVAAMQTSVNAEGSALTEHEKWMDSIQAKQQQFQAQYQTFANSFLNSDLIKGTFDAGTGILGWLTGVVEKFGALPALMATVTPFFNKMQFFKTSSTGTGFVPFWQAGKVDLDNDISLLNDYNSKIQALGNSTDNLVQRQIIWNDTIGRGSESLKTAVRVTETSTVTTEAYGAAMQGASAKTTMLSVGAKAASIAVNALKMALNMLISFGITLALSAIISAISKLVNKAKEAREAAIAAGADASANAQKIYDLAAAYIRLSEAVEAGTASKNDMLSIQNDLVTALGLEGKSVHELQGEYDSLRESIIAATRQQLQTDISVGINASNSAKEEAVKNIEKWLGGTDSFSGTGDSSKEAFEYLKDIGFSGINIGTKGGTLALPNNTTTDLFSDISFDQIMENYKYLEDAMNAVREKFGGDNPVFETLSDAYNEYHDAVKTAIEKIDETNQSIAYDLLLAQQAIDTPETQEEFEQFRRDIVESVENSLNFDDAGTYSPEAVVDKILSQNEQYKDFLTALQERETTAVEISNKMQTIAEAIVPKNFEDLEPGSSSHFHAIDEWATKAEDVKAKLRDLSDEEFEIAYDAVVNQGATTWEEITRAIEQYNSAQEIARRRSETLKNSIRELWKSEDFEDAKEDLLALSKTLDGITPEAIEEIAAESEDLSAILQQDGMDAKFLAKILQSMARGEDSLALITDDALKLNQALFDMRTEFDEVTAAKSRYDAAMSVDEKDTNFKSYTEAFETLNEQFEAGTVNSNAFWAAAEYLFGDEQLAAWGWSDGLDEIYDAMKRNEVIFKDADSAGAGFIERLYQMSKAGKMVDENGEDLLEISKLADGSYDFDIDTENLDKIAEKMGITKEAVVACLEALSMWGDVNFYDLEEVSKTIEEIGLSAESVDGTAINASRLTEQLLSLGKTNKEIHDILSALQDLDGVTLLDVSTDVDTLTGSLQDLGLATSDGINVSVNYEGLADLLVNIGFTKDEAETLMKKLGEADNITLANADGEVKDVSSALEYIDTLTFTQVTENIGNVTDAISDVDDSSTDKAVSELDNVGSAAETAATKVYSIGTAMDAINGKSTTVYFDVKRKNSILGSIFGFASGTEGAPGGPSLVGEEGIELVQSGRYAYLVGTDGAEIVNLNRGDRVFNADDTKRILSTASDQGHIKGVLPAYAWGTINTGQGKTGATGKYPQYNFSSSDSKGGSSSSGSPWDDELKYYQHLRTMELLTDQEYYEKLNGLLSKYYANREAYIDDYRSLMEEAYQLARELADDWFNDKEHQLFLMDKNDASEQDQISVYKQMQAEAHRLAEEARAYGLNENSDYIQQLQKQWWDYQDAIEDLYNEIYQGELRARENTLSLLENQYNILDNNRSRDAMGDNLERQLAEQKAIQEAAHKEAQRLRALGVDENDDAIQECVDTWWGAYDAIQDINSRIADNVLSVYDDFIEYADDFDMWSNFNFTKVDYLKQKLKEINRLFAEGVLTLKEYNSLLKDVGVEIYNEQKEALTTIIEMTMELVRQEAEDKIDALEEQISDFQKIIDLKKESLRVSKDEEDYQTEVAKRVKEIAEKQAKLAQLERDTSSSTNAEKARLAQELADLQNELAEYQADYAYNSQVDALDKQADAYEDTKNDEIDYLKSTIDTEEKLYNEAISRINDDWDALYADLIEWNRQYGDMIDGEDSITSAWKTAKEAAQEYGDVVSALSGINSEIYTHEQEAASKQAQVDSILSQMSKNGAGWHSAPNQTEKNRLVKANEALAEQLSALIGRPVLKDQAGVWHLDSLTGPRLFHTGLKQGYVGADHPGKDEVLSVLEDGELVFTKDQYMRVFNSLKYGIYGILDTLLGNLTTQSPVVSEVVKSISNDNSSTDNSITEDGITLQNYFYLQDMTQENMERFAEMYSTYTINKLNSTSRRKGLKNSFGNSMLRG